MLHFGRVLVELKLCGHRCVDWETREGRKGGNIHHLCYRILQFSSSWWGCCAAAFRNVHTQNTTTHTQQNTDTHSRLRGNREAAVLQCCVTWREPQTDGERRTGVERNRTTGGNSSYWSTLETNHFLLNLHLLHMSQNETSLLHPLGLNPNFKLCIHSPSPFPYNNFISSILHSYITNLRWQTHFGRETTCIIFNTDDEKRNGNESICRVWILDLCSRQYLLVSTEAWFMVFLKRIVKVQWKLEKTKLIWSMLHVISI